MPSCLLPTPPKPSAFLEPRDTEASWDRLRGKRGKMERFHRNSRPGCRQLLNPFLPHKARHPPPQVTKVPSQGRRSSSKAGKGGPPSRGGEQ